MKSTKSRVIVLLVSLAGIIGLAQTTTPNLLFSIPAIHSVSWGQAINDNFTKLDKLLSGTLALPPGFWSNSRATSNTPGGVQLATGPTNTTAENFSNKNQPGGYAGIDLTGNLQLAPSSKIVADNQVGADLGARIQTADTRCGADPCAIEVALNGQTWSSHFNLHLGHALLLHAAINITTGSATLYGNNYIGGYGSSSLLNFTGTGQPALFVPNSGAHDITFNQLNLTATTGDPILFDGSGLLFSNFMMNGTVLNSAESFRMDGATANNLVFTNTSSINAGDYHILFNGLVTNVRVATAYCHNVGNCVEFYSFDSASQPSRASIMAGASNQITITNVNCDSVNACIWGSVAWDAIIYGNYAAHCGDVCFDGEGWATVLWASNVGKDAANGVFATFASGYDEVFQGNFGYQTNGHPVFLIKNKDPGNTSHYSMLAIRDNEMHCIAVPPTTSVPNPVTLPCAGIQYESVSFTQIIRNHFFDSYMLPTVYGSEMTITYNDLFFDVAGSYIALPIPSQIDGTLTEVAYNKVRSMVPGQTNLCFSGSNGDFNHGNVYNIHHNWCFGMATTKAGDFNDYIGHLTQSVWVHDNTWDSLVVSGEGNINLVNAHNSTFMGAATN